MIYIVNKRQKIEKIREQYPDAVILDITSTSKTKQAQMLSPFYPHGNIPIPLSSNGLTATCVEAVWQGLKVFEDEDVSITTFKNDTMRNLKRTVRKHGLPKGHRSGVYGTELLDYFNARMKIYLPTYKWVLDNIPSVHDYVQHIAELSKTRDIVLLNYNTNIEIRNISSPLSHAGLVKLYIEGKYPNPNDIISPIVSKKRDDKRTSKTNSKQLKLFE